MPIIFKLGFEVTPSPSLRQTQKKKKKIIIFRILKIWKKNSSFFLQASTIYIPIICFNILDLYKSFSNRLKKYYVSKIVLNFHRLKLLFYFFSQQVRNFQNKMPFVTILKNTIHIVDFFYLYLSCPRSRMKTIRKASLRFLIRKR